MHCCCFLAVISSAEVTILGRFPCAHMSGPVLSYSVVSDSATPGTVALQAPLSMGILQARIPEWVTLSFSRGSSQPRDETRVSCSSCLGVGSLSFLQGIVPTQGSNPGLPHCREILNCLSHQGSPRILERVAYPSSRGSSRPRNQTWVSCIVGRFFTS